MAVMLVETEEATKNASSRFRCIAGLALTAVLGLSWGCSGIISGSNSSNTAAATLTYGISGTITPAAGGAGATVTLSGASSTTVTASNTGVFSFTGLANGSYVVTPGNTGYSFAPATQAVTISGTSVTGVNFTATAQGPTYSISGTISPTTGGAGATVTLSGAAAASTLTDSAGNYSLGGLLNGAYTVTPSNTGYSFSPVSQNVTVSGVNVTGINFTAALSAPHSVSLSWGASPTTTVTGYNVYRSTVSGSLFARVNSLPVAGLSYTDASVQGGTIYFYVATAVDGSGNESIFSNQVSAAVP